MTTEIMISVILGILLFISVFLAFREHFALSKTLKDLTSASDQESLPSYIGEVDKSEKNEAALFGALSFQEYRPGYSDHRDKGIAALFGALELESLHAYYDKDIPFCDNPSSEQKNK